MAMIYISPDRTSYTNLPEHIISPELETITGADMLISSFPVEVFSQNTLQAHIQSRGLFVQIKIGYDILNFDGIHNFCARIQSCKIPKSQAILLIVGEYWRDENELFRVKGQKPYGETTWRNFRRAMMGAMGRGVTVYPEFLSSMDELPEWIEDYQEMLQKFETEGKRELYPTRIIPQFEPEDVFQSMIEVNKRDPRYIMVAGLDKFGEKKALSTFQYITENFPHIIKIEHKNGKDEYLVRLYHFWKVLTDEDEKGKAVHNVPGWGDKSRKDFREVIGLTDGINLSISSNDSPDGYLKGWYTFGNTFRDRIKNGESANSAFDTLMKMVDEFGGI